MNSLRSTPDLLEVQPPPISDLAASHCCSPNVPHAQLQDLHSISVLPTHDAFRRIPIYHLEIVAQETPMTLFRKSILKARCLRSWPAV